MDLDSPTWVVAWERMRGAALSPPVGLEFVIRPPLEAGPCPGSGRSNAHG